MDTKGVLSSPPQSQSTAQLKYVQELATSGEQPPPKYFHKDVNVQGKQVTTDDFSSVPIIDISRLTSNASIEEKEEEMAKLKSALNSWCLFQGFGSDSIGANIDGQVLDWSDRLYLLNEPVDERKLRYWPGDDSPLHFRRTLEEYSVQTRSESEIILKAMAKSLGLEENDFLNQLGDRQYVYTRFNFYPPCSRPDLVYGLKAHTDG